MIFYFSGVDNSAWVAKEKSPLMGRFFFVGMSVMSEVMRLRRVMSALPRLCVLRQRTPTGTCDRGIGWGIVLPNVHEQQKKVPRLHIGI